MLQATWLASNFSPKEIDILACLLCAKSSKRIAAVLGLKAKTVDNRILFLTQKLGVHSRVGIISLIEKSGESDALRVYYEALLRAHNFKATLQKTAELVRQKHIMCRLLCTDNILLEKITLDLKKAGIHVSDDVHAKTIQIALPIEQEIPAPEDQKRIIYVGNDELLFFEIVDHLCPSAWIREACEYFTTHETTTYQLSGQTQTLQNKENARPWWISPLYITLVFLFLFACGFLYMRAVTRAAASHSTFVHSVFATPDDTHRLDRPHLMNKIIGCFKENTGIYTVVLIGIGGSGKTTLARQYARLQNAPIVWEVNAETKNSLIDSFEQLAYATSKTLEEKTELSRIKSMTNESAKKKLLLFFVQHNLRNIKKPWCLIFDNVEQFSDIQEFFPQDTATWANGQVLITTQNEHIANHPQIGNRCVIHVEELNDQERFAFFSKLVFGSANPVLDAAAKQEAYQFLKNIPPYPLDISLAAHDITSNRLTYQQCIERQKSTNLEVAADFSDYKKTRYSTIVTNMKSLIQTYPGFQELFFLVALVGSQRIPKDLLLACQDQQTVDRFIDHMKRLSFMTHDHVNKRVDDADANTLSIHRSTQDVIFTYFSRSLDRAALARISLHAVEILECYTNPFIADVNIPKARAILNHLLMAHKHQALLSPLGRGILNLQLGRIYYCLYDLKNASQFSQASLHDLQAHYRKTVHIRLARAFACFGIAHKMVENDYEKGMRCLEKSRELGFPAYLSPLGNGNV